MSPGKHGPNRLASYIETHNTHMQQVLRGGFVLSEDLGFDPLEGFLILSGRIKCEGGIYISVWKRIALLSNAGASSAVQTAAYSYNVAVAGMGNVFRYDSPHPDHNRDHHVHRFDVLNGDKDGKVEFIFNEENIPTLREVIEEAGMALRLP